MFAYPVIGMVLFFWRADPQLCISFDFRYAVARESIVYCPEPSRSCLIICVLFVWIMLSQCRLGALLRSLGDEDLEESGRSFVFYRMSV